MSRPDHPALETLLELAEGELPPAAEALAREHLRGCAECRERWRALGELTEPPAAAAIGAGPEEKAAAWRELGRILPLGAAAPAALPAFRRQAAGPAPRGQAALWLAAATLAAAAGALWWLAPGPGLPGPGLLVAASTQLLPEDFAVLGRQPERETASCPPPEGSFVFILGGLGGGDGGGKDRRVYEIELKGPGTSLETSAGVNGFGELELVLRRGALANGGYRIRVRPREGNDPVKEYRLILDCP